MSERRVPLLEVSADEKEHLETLAHQPGYETVDAYVRALIQTG